MNEDEKKADEIHDEFQGELKRIEHEYRSARCDAALNHLKKMFLECSDDWIVTYKELQSRTQKCMDMMNDPTLWKKEQEK